ncbi:Protein CBG21429 [Caenorhabditis briggsae]|uniref:Protein CBG21429 n=1 Tax=Caenorhabditis briggsae TaxID=6238 RepID=A8Y019_CAEBR|nr:Protein CBG21429 [Caenorhabditis briggsae]CAP38236.2 Protein CBG21429 [Caenorhabditis briggsae]
MNKIITQGFGFHLISVSLVGLTINAYMFQNLLNFPKSSYYILCCSKTVSNCLSLLVYLSYSGPTNFFYTQIGSCTLNSYLNQSQYGLMLLEKCRVSFIFPHVPCLNSSDCNDQMIFYFAFSLFALAVTTNFLNILIAAKLFCMSDWIYVLDFINNYCASQYCSEDLCLTVITMGVDVLIYTADG